MAQPRKVAAVLVALTIAASLFGPVASAVNESTGVQSVDNETVTADVGNWAELDGYDVDSSSVTVEWYNSTSSSYETVSSGTDYELNASDGSIKALSGGDIGDGDELRVTYNYSATSGTTTTVGNLVPLFMALLIIGVLAARIQEMM